MENSIYIRNYLPVLERFAEETKDTYKDGYNEGVFVPYAFEGYWDADLKVFYIGRDTAYWLTDEKSIPNVNGHDVFLEHRDKGNLKEYLQLNSECVTPERLVDGDMRTGPGVFWDFIQKLHIRLLTGEYKGSLRYNSREERMLIKGAGYGEAYCVELPQSLEHEYSTRDECWEYNNWEHYQSVAKAAEKLADIKLLLETFSPDLVILTCWQDDLSALSGLETECVSYSDMYCAFTVRGFKTKFIQTYHPRYLVSRFGGEENVINTIAEVFESWPKE